MNTQRILFVCLGNICRSPAAEGVMRQLVAQAGLSGRIEVSSAGTGGWHAGELPDARMRAAAARRGYSLQSRARQLVREDFGRQDLIVVMDDDNQARVLALAGSEADKLKVRRLCEFCSKFTDTEVPDPYYGGPAGFEHVLDLLEDGCAGLLKALRA
jgi:protein-tyrosine phosphatase